MISIGAMAPSSARRLLSLYCRVSTSNVCRYTRSESLNDTRSQYRPTTFDTVAMTCCLNWRSEVRRWLRATRIARLFTAVPNPWRKFCEIVRDRVALVVGLKLFWYEFWLNPNVFVMFMETLVPVKNPF